MAGQGDTIARRRIVPIPALGPGGRVAASDLPGTGDAGTIDPAHADHWAVDRTASPEFRQQHVTHVARDLGISIDGLCD